MLCSFPTWEVGVHNFHKCLSAILDLVRPEHVQVLKPIKTSMLCIEPSVLEELLWDFPLLNHADMPSTLTFTIDRAANRLNFYF